MARSCESLLGLLDLMARLRDPREGCPWDRRQDWRSIAPYTLEEAYEVVDAIERDDAEALCDELGDLLFQVVFHARIAEEAGHFDFADVAEGITRKMVRRHPHVFGDRRAGDEERLRRDWEAAKAAERARAGEDSRFAGVARALPATERAHKLQSRAARSGLDRRDPGASAAAARVAAALRAVSAAEDDEARRAEALGDLLFAAVDLTRRHGLRAETVLRAANDRFERRFRALERRLDAGEDGREAPSGERLDAAWTAVREEER